MNDDQAAAPALRRSRVPSVRVLVVVALVLTAGAVYLGVVLPYQRQMELIQQITMLRGEVWTTRIGPRWLRVFVGEYRMKGLERITEIYLDESFATDDTLELLTGQTDLTLLSLNKSHVTDRGLAHLSGLPNLRVLLLSDTKITDEGLKLLKCENLIFLALDRTDISIEGLRHLVSADHLKNLDIMETGITEDDIKMLQPLLSSCTVRLREAADYYPPFRRGIE